MRDKMMDSKTLMIGLVIGIAVVFSLGASNKKGKKGNRPIGMFQVVAIPNNDGKAIILNTASGEFKIANIGISPNFESGERFKGAPPE